MARRSTDSAVQPAHSQIDASDMEVDETQRLSELKSLLQTPWTNYKELEGFDAKVAAEQQELVLLLEQRTRQADEASMRRRTELLKAIIHALGSPNHLVYGTPPTLGDTNIARNAVFESVAQVLTESEHLIGEYDRLDKVIVAMRKAMPGGVAEGWVEHVEKTARLLWVGAETAIANVKQILGADVGLNDVEHKEGGEKMDTVEKMELNYELKRSLYFAERGVKQLTKSLPRDE